MTTILKRLLMGLVFCAIVLTAAPAQAFPEKDAEFVATVRSDWKLMEEANRYDLVKAARLICRLLDNFEDPQEIFWTIKKDTGGSKKNVREFLNTSTKFYCTWNGDLV